MHVLLVNISRKSEFRIPQGLLYLASALDKAGHKVEICDEALFSNHKTFLKHILTHKANIIGFSVYSVPWQLERVENICCKIKQQSQKLIIWGGWHATLYPKHSILNDYVDIVFKGPAEQNLCYFLECLEHNEPLEKVPGLVFIQDGCIVETQNSTFTEKSLFPELNFDLIDINSYLNQHDIEKGILQYIASRGCNGGCKFCVMSKIFNQSLFRKPTELVIRELNNLYKKYDIKTIHFSDDNAFRNNNEARELCDIIRKITDGENIPWRCATRADTLSRISEETYNQLKDTKCKGFLIGIESGDNRVLQLMHKNIRVSQIDQAIEKLERHGFKENLFFFLFNYDGETKKEAYKTIKLACRVRMLFKKSDIALYNYYPMMSDKRWLSEKLFSELNLPLSKIFSQKAEELSCKKVAGMDLEILRFYFSSSKIKKKQSSNISSFISKLIRQIIYIRMQNKFFLLPFEFYLIKFAKMIRKI